MTQEKIKTKVQKLLNQATDREGTPEGDVFYQKAFDLMAEYGFEERDLRDASADNGVQTQSFELAGAYTDMQARLLLSIAGALHCVGFNVSALRGTKVASVTIFGLRHHVQRVEMLFLILNPRMLTEAMDQVQFGRAIISRRRSFMIGFASNISTRLHESEAKISHDHHEYGIALLDDLAQARQSMEAFMEQRQGEFKQKRSNLRLNPDAFDAGANAAKCSDIGQKRFGERLAIAN